MKSGVCVSATVSEQAKQHSNWLSSEAQFLAGTLISSTTENLESEESEAASYYLPILNTAKE